MKYSEQSDHDVTPRVKFIWLFKNVIFSRNAFVIYFPENDTKNLAHLQINHNAAWLKI